MAHISIYFSGQYRPAHYEAENFNKCIELAAHGVGRIPDLATRRKLQQWLRDCGKAIRNGYAAFSVDHGPIGVKLATYERDKFLDSATAALPEFPGLNYSPTLR